MNMQSSLDFNLVPSRAFFSPEEWRLCRACEAEFDVERDEAPAPVGNGTDPFEPEAAKINGPDPDPPKLMPYRDALVRFVEVMFRNARKDGCVSFRVFEDNGRSEQAVLIQAFRLDDHEFVPLMMLIGASRRRTGDKPAVFAPPVCTFKNHATPRPKISTKASALSVECDQAPGAARGKLEALLGRGHHRGRERRRMDRIRRPARSSPRCICTGD